MLYTSPHSQTKTKKTILPGCGDFYNTSKDNNFFCYTGCGDFTLGGKRKGGKGCALQNKGRGETNKNISNPKFDRSQKLSNKCLSCQVRRWHPDKFTQKLGSRIVPDQKEKVTIHIWHKKAIFNIVVQVMERIKAVAQALNDYGKPAWL